MFNLNTGTYSKTYACDLVNMDGRTTTGLSPFAWRCPSAISTTTADYSDEALAALHTEVYPDPFFYNQ